MEAGGCVEIPRLQAESRCPHSPPASSQRALRGSRGHGWWARSSPLCCIKGGSPIAWILEENYSLARYFAKGCRPVRTA